LPQLAQRAASFEVRNVFHGATVVASMVDQRGVVMSAKYSRVMLAMGLMGMSAAALAGEPRQGNPQEPAGFVTGAVIGAFAGGPIGAVVGAGLGTWLGNRVHRASDAKKAEAQAAMLQTDNTALQTEKTALLDEKSQLLQSNQTLTAQLSDVSKQVEAVQSAKADASEVLDGLEGDVLFRTGSAEISPQIAHQVQVLAEAVAKSPALKIRVDGYADPRGTADDNMKLSQDRANAVRDLLLAAGLDQDVLEVNAYGKTQSVAADSDGYALERRVRLTLQIEGAGTVARNADSPCCR
jgi:outer membrane protein OmpA-like peptidoglycan-associated protein